MKYALLASLLMTAGIANAEWLNDKEVDSVAVNYGNGCVTLNDGSVVKIDLGSDRGKAEWALILSAQSSGKKVDVYLKEGEPLEGGCNTGTSIRSHDMIKVDS